MVAASVAKKLQAPLDVVVPRKIGDPRNPEFAVAALALAGEDEILIRDEESLSCLGISDQEMARLVSLERLEIERRTIAYRHGRMPAALRDARVLIVDDGIATGLTARAAVAAVRAQAPTEVIVATPVAPMTTVRDFERRGVRLEACLLPKAFRSVGEFYLEFRAVEDDEVRAVLEGARRDA